MDDAEDLSAAVARIQKAQKEVRLSHANLCKAAKVDPATWWRYRRNPEKATITTIGDLEKAIAERRREMTA